ncbi:ADP-heptose:LPS heptosyltransferase [Candidatus Burkholderia pumila]|uniref:ADP-heptose:LPS heptosyltransferase n=1 Tax=Candidatus Burkholderia pumila TaxID=1090375 RepID=A0ABR5HMG8_9BURK|nr:ADP-heptose:LPS heptosyltransferase [Candidatus Burkholderia pumila]
MTPAFDHLDDAHALAHAGSLLSGAGEIVAPYDLEVSGASASGFSVLPDVFNAGIAPFDADYAHAREVHLINAFGISLGDSIIGLSALFALKRLHPPLRFTVYRPARSPRYVQRLYELAAPMFGKIVDLPVSLARLPADALKIDIGNQVFWPRFASMPMIDFFLWAIGVAPASVPARDKRNRWLADLPLPPLMPEEPPYVLFCPAASTPVRSIPEPIRAHIVDRVWKKFGRPVLGFGAVDHAHYRDIATQSRESNIADYFAWVKHARYVVTSDTAALHIAAGFDVPATSIFTTIASRMRARDYTNCVSIELLLPELQGVHSSAREADLEALRRIYGAYDWHTMPFA